MIIDFKKKYRIAITLTIVSFLILGLSFLSLFTPFGILLGGGILFLSFVLLLPAITPESWPDILRILIPFILNGLFWFFIGLAIEILIKKKINLKKIAIMSLIILVSFIFVVTVASYSLFCAGSSYYTIDKSRYDTSIYPNCFYKKTGEVTIGNHALVDTDNTFTFIDSVSHNNAFMTPSVVQKTLTKTDQDIPIPMSEIRKLFDGSFVDILPREDGTYVILFNIHIRKKYNDNIGLIAIDKDKNILWEKIYKTYWREKGVRLEAAENGGIYIFGKKETGNQGYSDYINYPFRILLNPDGSIHPLGAAKMTLVNIWDRMEFLVHLRWLFFD